MTDVSVWAPFASRVRIAVAAADAPIDAGAAHDLGKQRGGWWQAAVPDLAPGCDYGFVLDDDLQVLPDPRSRRQPHGVHGPSRCYVDDYVWSDDAWSGRGLPGAVFYELHIGTFTAEGTFDAAAEKLDHLVALGVTHVEILPVNDFNGEWNWGYDGVLWYAVHEAYGGPDGLKRFVDACHGAGLSIVLDVVYNHLGPSGNYLPRFGPYLTDGRNTWGQSLNLDGAGSRDVRDYILANAEMWLTEFHIDGLRLDAVHALRDSSPVHLLAELSERVEQLSRHQQRPLTLIAESDLNDPVMIRARSDGAYGLDGQWNDDVHHTLHALLTGERQGYYCDFGSLEALAKTLTHAFFHDGTFSTFRGRLHGVPIDTATTPGYQFVVCLQNHDQVGNRAAGDRLPALVSPDLLKVGATLLLTSPFTPMLWMGEEWAASTPWPFFTSHPEPELAKATADGRIEEFAEHGWRREDVRDPQEESSFRDAKLRWSELAEPDHAGMLDVYRALIQLRRDNPGLSDPDLTQVTVAFDETRRWIVVYRPGFAVAANLAEHVQSVPITRTVTGIAFATAAGTEVSDSGVSIPGQAAVVLACG